MSSERSSRRTLYELGSEYFREASVLIAVFGFLEKIITGHPVSTVYGVSVIGLSFVLFVLGYALEILGAK